MLMLKVIIGGFALSGFLSAYGATTVGNNPVPSILFGLGASAVLVWMWNK